MRDYDRRHRAELIPTLEAFLDCDGSWTRCAARLHLHVNTLRYRVGRIEQLTSRDLSRLEDKLDFFLALRMNGHRGGAGKTLRKKVSPPARRW